MLGRSNAGNCTGPEAQDTLPWEPPSGAEEPTLNSDGHNGSCLSAKPLFHHFPTAWSSCQIMVKTTFPLSEATGKKNIMVRLQQLGSHQHALQNTVFSPRCEQRSLLMTDHWIWQLHCQSLSSSSIKVPLVWNWEVLIKYWGWELSFGKWQMK